MNTGYMLYQVERPKSAREQYEIDRSNAKLAAAIGRFGRLLARPARPGAGAGGGGEGRE